MNAEMTMRPLDMLAANPYQAKPSEDLNAQGINVVDSTKDLGIDFEGFLQLMVQQLQNQTMDSAADTGEMLNQLVQMSTVEMLTTVKESVETLVEASTLGYAASLVGKTVTVGCPDGNGGVTEVVGTVTGTGIYQGGSVLFVDGEMYGLSDVMAVGTLPKLPESP